MSGNEIYWINVIGNLKATLMPLTAILGVAAVMCGVGYFVNRVSENSNDLCKFFIKSIKVTGFSFLACLLLNVFIPSKQAMVEMKVIPAITSSELVNNLPEYIEQYIEILLEGK